MDEIKIRQPRVHTMNDGRETMTSTAECVACEGFFYVPAASLEFEPKFCCYCGVRFTKTLRDEPKDSPHA